MSAKFQDNFLRAVVSFENRKIQLGVVSVYNQLTQKDIDAMKAEIEHRKRETKEAQDSEATVYNSTSGGEQTPYVTKEVNPKVEGVVVIAEGGGNAVVIKNITEAIQALFDVDTHKIKVMKRNQTN